MFVTPNVRVLSEANLAEALGDELLALREQLFQDAYTRDLARLTASEAGLYDELRFDRIQSRLRLEPERIVNHRVEEAVSKVVTAIRNWSKRRFASCCRR